MRPESQKTTDTPPYDSDELTLALVACAQGDETALKRIYDLTSGTVFGRLLRLLRDKGLAEDALQEVYVSVWRNAGRFDRSRGTVMAWITTIARNRAFTVIRSRAHEVYRPEPDAELRDEGKSPEAELVGLDDARALAVCLERLPEDARAALLRAYWDGLSYADVAVWAARPIGTMKSLIRRSLQALRACLEES